MSGAIVTREKPGDRYVFLDGLRGIAALAVAILHATAIVAPVESGLEHVSLAVDFFFCLSGFVVAQAYDLRLSTQMTVGEFMVRRLIRLYPMILLGVALGLGAHLYVSDDTPGRALALAGREVLIIPSPNEATGFILNLPMWSLLFEIAACLGYAVAVKRLPARALPWLAAGSGIILAVGVAIAGQISTFGVAGPTGLLCGIPRVAFPFLIGALMQRSGLASRLPRFHPLIGIAVLLAVLFAPLPASAGYDILAVVLLLPAVLLVGAATPAKGRAWEIVGRLSYPLYLVHWPVLHVVSALSPFGSLTTEALGILASLVVAHLALTTYDEPLRRWLTRRQLAGALKAA